MIYIKENFLSIDECSKLIKFYKKNKTHSYLYRDTYPLPMILFNENFIENIHLRVIDTCQSIFSGQKLIIDNCEIVKWPKNSKQDSHRDIGDFFAVLIYLNDNFNGGKTCFDFEDIIKIKPETGKCLIFSSSKYLHWVEPVENNTRYTLAYWFVNPINK